MLTIIIFIVVLSVLIFVHELGHFVAAKASRMRVDEFAIGFPPRIFGKKKGETLYAINALPIGGYVKIHGEDPNEQSETGPDSARSFSRRPKWMQFIVLIAGVSFNMIFAWLAISIGLLVGYPVPDGYLADVPLTETRTIINEVIEGTPAAESELVIGDEVISVTDASGVTTPTPRDQTLREIIRASNNQPIALSIMRNQATQTVAITPVFNEELGYPTVGVGLATIGMAQLGPIQSFISGARITYDMTFAVVDGLWTFVTRAFSGETEVLREVSGPVGIARLVGDASAMGFSYLVSLTALISINLAVINILPFPALDGGRLLFVIIESLSGWRVPVKFQNYANAFGLILLLGLMLLITISDVFKLF